ncbi:MAG: tRNA (guanosine(37)-N1)-methyltransferase TrmD [Gammaproteobacteria bacterium TMED92]|nr:MAG: tRNA (guanosine(37)-N1)-methyltransferase TrmD [Gammaproteobacteria bacterium TMED92]
MWLGIVTLFPDMFAAVGREGVFGRAIEAGVVTMEFFNPREYTSDRHRTVDDRPYGGGAGMVMKVQPLLAAVEAAKQNAPAHTPVVLMSPQGHGFAQADVAKSRSLAGLILVCGRYEGVDERFVQRCVDIEWSIGDYVLTGGELPAMVVMDAIARHLPGTLGNQMSALDESYLDATLDYPHYTRPETLASETIPQQLLSGDHGQVARYRRREALKRTLSRRPELLTARTFDAQDRELLLEIFADRQPD